MNSIIHEGNQMRIGKNPGTFLVILVVLLAFGAGCGSLDTGMSKETTYWAMPSIPKISPGSLRPDQALVAAFFNASGIRLTPAQVEAILPTSAPQGSLDRDALQSIAKKHRRSLTVVQADERFLWEALGRNLPLLVLLPPNLCYSPAATPLIPVAWDQQKKTLDLLNGNGEIQTISEAAFFTRREPLKQAALCLVKPGDWFGTPPAREQTLLLADFWYNPSFYRSADVAYSALQEEKFPEGSDVGALMARGNELVRAGRYREAIPVYQAALDLQPDDPKILNNLAYCLLNGQGTLMTALRHANKANQLDPGNPLILETLGSINLGIGDVDTAVRCLKQAWARSLKHPSETQVAIMDQLVRAWLAADRQDLARQVAEYRIRTFPHYRFARDILNHFPSLRSSEMLTGKNILPEGG